MQIYLERFDFHQHVLSYNTARGTWNPLLRNILEKKYPVQYCGYFEGVAENVCGFFASGRGPVFFWNERQFPLQANIFKIEIAKGKKVNSFTLLKGQEKIINFNYLPATFLHFDNWSTEENCDFFVWLQGQLQNEVFYQEYTKG